MGSTFDTCLVHRYIQVFAMIVREDCTISILVLFARHRNLDPLIVGKLVLDMLATGNWNLDLLDYMSFDHNHCRRDLTQTV